MVETPVVALRRKGFVENCGQTYPGMVRQYPNKFHDFSNLSKAKSPKFTLLTTASLLVGRRVKPLGREPEV